MPQRCRQALVGRGHLCKRRPLGLRVLAAHQKRGHAVKNEVLLKSRTTEKSDAIMQRYLHVQKINACIHSRCKAGGAGIRPYRVTKTVCRYIRTCCHSSAHICTGTAATRCCRHCSACLSSCFARSPPSLVSWLGLHTCLTTLTKQATTAASHKLPGCLPCGSALHVCLTQANRLVSSCTAATLVP